MLSAHEAEDRFKIYHIYTDGSARKVKDRSGKRSTLAGWGFVVLGDRGDGNPLEVVDQQWGPVCLDENDVGFIGAEEGTNNTAEVSAIAEAMIWVQCNLKNRKKVILRYDSEYAACTIRRTMMPKKQ